MNRIIAVQLCKRRRYNAWTLNYCLSILSNAAGRPLAGLFLAIRTILPLF